MVCGGMWRYVVVCGKKFHPIFLSEIFSKAFSLSFVKNENKMGGHGPYFMPSTPIFLKHQFSENGPKNLTKVENFKFFSAFLVTIL